MSFSSFDSRKTAVLLLLITVLAAALRLYRLGAWSFWIDEVYSVQAAHSLAINLRQDPIFALLEFPLTAAGMRLALLGGQSEWAARLFPALVGTVSVPILFGVVRRLWDTAVGLVSALLLAVSPWHIYWSQNARFYVLLLLFYTLALFFFYLWLEENRRRYLLYALLCFGLAATERLLAIFFVPTAVLYLAAVAILPIAKPPGYSKRYAVLLLVVAGAVLLAATAVFWRSPGLWQSLYAMSEVRGPADIVLQHLRGVDPQIWLLAAAGGLWLWWRGQRAALFLLLSASVPLLSVMVASLMQFTQGRYTFVSLTSWLILAGATAVYLWRFAGRRPWVALLLGVILVAPSLQELQEYYFQRAGERPAWKTAFQWVEAQRQGDDLLVTNDPVVGTYYTGHTYLAMRDWQPQLAPQAVCQQSHRIWFVVGGGSRISPQSREVVMQWATAVDLPAHNVKVYLIDPAQISDINPNPCDVTK